MVVCFTICLINRYTGVYTYVEKQLVIVKKPIKSFLFYFIYSILATELINQKLL